ncbi:t-complex protein 1 eta subunit [Fragilariopsis cylindrus CCMP1102]|uniref:T-complex protein 1 subunit eta n=1 Tax=Fragilariopsis cylindrus CCMP1102 TaxID=635003 RepID=A0A1E7FBY4_9STRA|nr:t-complex protein 1 eta subunit [Fragilariopsis cylindrus CCMP1102]|eukprot:OEU15670.1 t-complex protein 1 eta subunit [Fragilariopsis cylindrus CCMP1102]
MNGMQPGIIILREGTDTSQGIPQLVSNINACQAVADSVRTTLGPRGMDKLVAKGSRATISNDGATIMKLLEVAHPAAKTLVDISMSQDTAVGDGTTSVVLLAAEILAKLKPLVEEGISPTRMIQTIRKTGKYAVDRVAELAVTVEQEEMLLKCAGTALNSKLISSHRDLFAPMVVSAVTKLHQAGNVDEIMDWISIKQIPGGDVRQSFLVEGVAFRKTFSYAGFEQMTKRFENPKILLLNVELELKSEKENAEVRISTPAEYQSIVEAEWQVIYDKLDACINCGANIVLSKLPIGDLATQYFADRGLFCAGRVNDGDMKRVAVSTKGAVQTTTSGLTESILGTCGLFEESQVGDERFNLFTQCPSALTCTIVLRGGTEQFIAESERSVHDALMVVKRTIQSGSVVAGGGAVEMCVSNSLRRRALEIEGKEQLIVSAYSKALEVIPRQLCENAGLDATDVLAALRRKHRLEGDNVCWYGVNIEEDGITDTFDLGVWEPSDNKMNSLQAATEAACVILSIDETVISPRSQDPGAQASGQMGGGGGMSGAMGNAMDIANSGGARTGQMGQGVSYMKGRGGG